MNGISFNAVNLDQPVSSRTTQASVNEVLQKLGEQEGTPDDVKLLLRIEIEKALAGSAGLSLVMRPQSSAGHLEEVRQVVHESILAHQGLGEDMAHALQYLADGDAALAAGDYKAAYGNFQRTYGLAVK